MITILVIKSFNSEWPKRFEEADHYNTIIDDGRYVWLLVECSSSGNLAGQFWLSVLNSSHSNIKSRHRLGNGKRWQSHSLVVESKVMF